MKPSAPVISTFKTIIKIPSTYRITLNTQNHIIPSTHKKDRFYWNADYQKLQKMEAMTVISGTLKIPDQLTQLLSIALKVPEFIKVYIRIYRLKDIIQYTI